MRRMIFAVVIVALTVVGLAPASQAKGNASNNFVAQLSGDNEVPSVDTDSHGTAHFHVKSDGTVDFKVVVNKPSATVVASHIHLAPAGVNGGVAVDLLGQASTVNVNHNSTVFSGSFVMPGGFVDTANAGNYYVNVHTVANPPGEIRGQLS